MLNWLYKNLWIYILISILLNGNPLYTQQQDSLQLKFEKLDWKDVKTNEVLSTSTKVISGSRSERKVEDLPFTIYVITGEEIRQNGYLTLVDVLKRLPGIRVSQPGSALEGETFLMRGLIGNAYAKILVNDIPIKPFVVNGMPIGAQLPIRQAERIEVIYGPGATLYGADASAGVINIILKESERPVYVQSDLGFGMDGYENLDIMFGGKLGKNKNVLTFKAFGNYTSLKDRPIKYDLSNLYNPNRYQEILRTKDYSYLDRPNYRGTDGSPLLDRLPHVSNSLGTELKYRNWQFSAFRFVRRDHSSLGLSPFAVSYANPLNFFGEQINTANLIFDKSKNKFRVKAGTGILSYNTDRRSSYSYVMPLLNLILQPVPDGSPQVDSISKVIDDRYFSNERFSSANSIEFNAEVLVSYSLNKHMEIASGSNFQAGIGEPLLNFSPRPGGALADTLTNKYIDTETTIYSDISSFVECYLNFNKWNAILGIQAFNRQTNTLAQQPTVFNPRVALQYHWTKKFSLRGSYGTSYKYSSPFYQSNSYSFSQFSDGFLSTGADLGPEKTISSEFGARWNLGLKVRGDVSAYYTRTTNLVNYGIDRNADTFTLGYFNDENSLAELYGIQASVSFTDIIKEIGLTTNININYGIGNESFTAITFTQTDDTVLRIDGLRSQPNWISQVDIELKPIKKIRLLFENTIMSKSWTRNSILYQIPSSQMNKDVLLNAGYYTLDLLGSYEFNKHLIAFIKVNNLFNKEYAGIDASVDADGLIYNPQPTRFIRIGINYRLD